MPTDPHDHDHEHGGVALPTTPAEAEAFVALVKAEPEASHPHGAGSGMALEHARLLELVPRGEATHVAIANGDWFDPATWHEGRIPGLDARVLIPQGVAVTYDGVSEASLFTVRVDGELAFATGADTRLVVDTLVVSGSGRLEIGTAADPVAAGVRAEIVIANNGDIDVALDPSLLSRGVISHGAVEIHGAEKTAFLAVDEAPMRGATEIRLSEIPEGWRAGDTIVLTGTHKQGWVWDNALRREVYRESQDEEVRIIAIDGDRIVIDRPLAHDHDAPRADLAAYVANMTRSVTIRSEDGDATPVHQRGHVMFMHSDDVDVRYAAFDDLGRTDKSRPAADAGTFGAGIEADSNVKGRYSLHLHETGVDNPAEPAFVVGNAVSGSPGWGFVQHSAHAVFTDNAAFDIFGAAFAAEDGDETGVWARNIAIRVEGIGYGEATVKQEEDLPRHDNGRTGDGFFFAGRLVEAVGNVAANATHGFVWMHRSAPDNPAAAAVEHPEIAYGADTIRLDQAPIQGFRDNEAFGAEVGLIVVKADARQEHDVRTVMDGFLAWETSGGMDLTYTSHYTVRNVDLIATRGGDYAEFGFRLGGNAHDMVVNGMRVEGFDKGVDLTSNFFTFPVTSADVGHVFIDVTQSDVGAAWAGFNAARHRVMNSADLVDGRLSFAMTGDLTISPGETLYLNGAKTDSIGTRNRQFTSVDDIQALDWTENILPLLRSEGYRTTQDGRRILLVEDLIADRATGQLLKFAHVVTLAMTDAQLAGYGAVNQGPIQLGGQAPLGVPDHAEVMEGRAVLIDVLANDSDPEGGTIRVDGIIQPKLGGALLAPDGRILYIAGIGVEGTDSFTYWVADNAGNFTPTTVTVHINPDDGQGHHDHDTDHSGGHDHGGGTGGGHDHGGGTGGGHDHGGGTGGRIRGTAAADRMWGSREPDQMMGMGGDDSLYGRGGDDTLHGGADGDRLAGGGGADRLLGGARADTLVGGAEDDRLVGGEGTDLLVGGPGRDLFVFRAGDGFDRIRDFRHGEDRIVFIRGNVDSFDEVVIVGRGAHTLIHFEGGRILVMTDDADDFSAEDFLF